MRASISLLALVLQDRGRWEEAKKLELQMMETSKTKLGAGHPDTLASMNNLALTYWNGSAATSSFDMVALDFLTILSINSCILLSSLAVVPH
ncbi:hypothetical protein C8A01DRAFT_20907 [Parachaetomium inaequale]|uniref:Kinesin light chain n=1 Tax=Parachaetomium inaequale TaxID=2588326 RepID=A0AAN6P560_9PEZI|nr:hypothetical protein C8A01DRAFT_20907 [Parachaetomium inaequale]